MIGDEAEQAAETERAVLGHVDAAEAVMAGYGARAVGAAQRQEVQNIRMLQAMEQMGVEDLVSAYIGGTYDSSADYWRLTRDGNIEYDGQANLVDEDGNVIISWEAMGLENNDDVWSALRVLLPGSEDAAGATTNNATVIDELTEYYTTNGGFDGFSTHAPEEMLFLLGAEDEYHARVARGLMETRTVENRREGRIGGLIDHIFGVRTEEVAIEPEEWIAGRIGLHNNDGNLPFVDFVDPDTPVGPWTALNTCTACAAIRTMDMVGSMFGRGASDVQQMIDDTGLRSQILGIANVSGPHAFAHPAEFRGNDMGTVLTMMGLTDGVRQYSMEDIANGELLPGAIITYWDNDTYEGIIDSGNPGMVNFGHTGINGGASVVDVNGTPQVQIQWIDQLNGANVNTATSPFWELQINEAGAIATPQQWVNTQQWSDTTLLGSHVFNDITEYQVYLGLHKLKTTLMDY